MGILGGRFLDVDKAAFVIGKKQKDDGTWEYDAPVEVLINPSSLRITASTQVKKDEGVANEKTSAQANADGKITPKGITQQEIEIVLLFNIVEAYQAKTEGVQTKALVSAAKSMLGSLIDGNLSDSAEGILTDLVNKTNFTGLSLFNKELCCYTPLLEASHKQVPVIFYWGNMMYSGLITKFSTKFDYFSSQGAPLGGEVTMVLCAAVDDESEKVSMSTQRLLGLVKEGGKLVRKLPGK